MSMLSKQEVSTPPAEATQKNTLPNVSPFAFVVVEDVYYIVGAREVGFGSDHVAISELTSAADALGCHPVVGINEQLRVPVVDLSGLNFRH